jgi:hypothetical protein
MHVKSIGNRLNCNLDNLILMILYKINEQIHLVLL